MNCAFISGERVLSGSRLTAAECEVVCLLYLRLSLGTGVVISLGKASGEKVGLTKHKCWFRLMVRGSFDKLAIRIFPATLSTNEGGASLVWDFGTM